MPSDAEDRRIVSQILAQAGIAAEPIPESSSKRCDLCAKDTEGGLYLLEIKGFHDDEAIVKTLDEGKVYSKVPHFDWSNAVDAAVKEAVHQLNSTARTVDGPLRIIAFVICTTFDADLVFQQILGTLYGKRSLLDGPSPSKHLECLYFSHSAFYRYRADLDGVLVVDSKGITFWLNDHGGRPDRVRESVLGKFFTRNGVLNDAASLEQEGLLVTDCNVDRNRVKEVLQFVKEKYHLEDPRLMPFRRFMAMARPERSDG
jgi:hypothetical protein